MTTLWMRISGLLKLMLAQGHSATEKQRPVGLQSPCSWSLGIMPPKSIDCSRQSPSGQEVMLEGRTAWTKVRWWYWTWQCTQGWRLVWLSREPMWGVFVGNEIGQQGSRGGACYRGHYKLARPDFTMGMCKQRGRNISWAAVHAGQIWKCLHIPVPKQWVPCQVCCVIWVWADIEKLFFGMGFGTYTFSLIFNCRNRREGLPLKICCTR